MQSASSRHEHFSHTLFPLTPTPLHGAATGSTAVSSSSSSTATTPVYAMAAVRANSTLTVPSDSFTDYLTTVRNVSFHERAAIEQKPAVTQHSLSTSAPMPAPPTPSNWMVRRPSSGGSLSAFSTFGLDTNHEFAVSASSFNSLVDIATVSPLLHSHSHNNRNSICNSTEYDSVGEGDGADSACFPMERTSGRKRTPRSTVLSGAASTGAVVGGGSGGTAAGVDGLATPLSSRLIFSRRTSAGDSVYESSDDLCLRARRHGSFALDGDDARAGRQTRLATDAPGNDDIAYIHSDGHRTEVQSTLHSSRSRRSGAPTPTTASLPAIALGITPMGNVMSDVLATASSADLETRLPLSPLKASVSGDAQHRSVLATANGTIVDVPLTTTTSGSRGVRSPFAQPASRAGAGNTAREEDIARPPADHTQRCITVLRPRLTGGGERQVESPSHCSGPLSSGALSTGHDMLTPALCTSNHLVCAAELPSWPLYSNSSSYCSLFNLSNDSEVEKDTESSEDMTAVSAAIAAKNADNYITAGQRHNSSHHQSTQHPSASTPIIHQAAASATTVTAALPCTFSSAAASATTHPFDHRKASSVQPHDAQHSSKPREVTAAVDTHGHPFPATTPLADMWMSDASAEKRRKQGSGVSEHHEGHHHYNHHHQTHGASTASSLSHHSFQPANVTASAAAAVTNVKVSSDVPVPVFSSTEAHPALPPSSTAHAHNGGNFLNYHPKFSHSFPTRCGTLATAAAPPDTAAAAVAGEASMVAKERGEGKASTSNECSDNRNNRFASMPPPPLPPPTPHIPSPITRAAASIACGFASSPAQRRSALAFSTDSSPVQSPGCVAHASGKQLDMTPSTPPSLSPSSLAESEDTKQQKQQLQPPLAQAHRSHSVSMRDSPSIPVCDRHSIHRPCTDKSNNNTSSTVEVSEETSTVVAQMTPPALPIRSCHDASDEAGKMEALIDGMPMMALPRTMLSPPSEGGNGLISAEVNPVVGHVYAHGQHYPQHVPTRGSSAGSNGGVNSSPKSKTRQSGPPTALTTGQSRDFFFTSNSSLYTTTPQTLTSVASDATVLSFSSTNLAAPMASNGSSNANMSNVYLTNSSSMGGGRGLNGAPTGQRTAAGTVDGFVMKPDSETIQSLPRGKVSRMPGCSMRDWTARLAVKEAESRHKQHEQRHGSGSARSSQLQKQCSGSNLLISGFTSFSSSETTSPFSSPTRQHSPGTRATLPRMTPQEIAKHNTPDDLWIVIRNVVYDCTDFQRFHPGGEKLLLACAGRDATEVYDRFHAWVSCESFMGPYAVGVLAPP